MQDLSVTQGVSGDNVGTMAAMSVAAEPASREELSARLADVQRVVIEMARVLQTLQSEERVTQNPVRVLIPLSPRGSPLEGAPIGRAPSPEQATRPDDLLRLKLVRKILRLRHKRAVYFGSLDLFPDPAWDILLDLYAASIEKKSVSISSACIASMVPSTTGLRWLALLEKQGLVTTENDPDDRRRRLVTITEEARKAVDAFVDDLLIFVDEATPPIPMRL